MKKHWYPSQIEQAKRTCCLKMRTKRLQKKLRDHPDRYVRYRTFKDAVSFNYPAELILQIAMEPNYVLKHLESDDNWGGNVIVPFNQGEVT